MNKVGFFLRVALPYLKLANLKLSIGMLFKIRLKASYLTTWSLAAIGLLLIPTLVHAQSPTDLTQNPTQNDTLAIYLPSISTESSREPTPEPELEPGDRLSAEERMVIVGSVETRVNELLPPVGTPIEERDFPGEIEQLGEELLTIPGVLATFVSTSTLTVQVVMEDGLSISIVNNRPVEPDVATQAAQTAAKQFVSDQVGTQNVVPRAVPGSNRAVVANFDGGDAVAAEVRALLSKAGYNVLGLGASLSDMQNYTDLGMLYLDTHGVQYQQFSVITKNDGSRSLSPGKFFYGLQTSTKVSLSTLESYQALLNNGEVILSLGEEETGRTVKFAITERFIANHWSFDDAVVLIHSCYGGSAPFKPGTTCKGGNCINPGEPGVLDPSALRTAMLAQGADAVVSFDNLTNTDYARPSILFLMDRLLGSNDVQAVTNPPLRPFPLDEVRAEMGRQNLLSFHKPNGSLFGIEYGGNTVNLTFDTTDTAARLAPTIERVTTLDDPSESEGELKIEGNFDDAQGEVTIDNIAATIKSWNETEIVVNTPFNGHGAAGDLIVKGPGDVESNPVPLTLWRGSFKVQVIPNQGTLETTANLDLHFRADLHESRQTLDATPTAAIQEVYLNSEESQITASGVYVDPENGNTVTWFGGNALKSMSKVQVDAFAQMDGQSAAAQYGTQQDGMGGGLVTLDPSASSARICLTIIGGVYYVQGNGQSLEIPFPGMLMGVPGLPDSMRGMLSCFDATLQEDYTIMPGSRSVNFEGINFLVEWGEFAPVSPPTAQTPG